jgi:hypothetical protein
MPSTSRVGAARCSRLCICAWRKVPLELGYEDLLRLPVGHRYLRAGVCGQRAHVLAERQGGSGIILEARCHRCGGVDRRATAVRIGRCRDQSFNPRRDGRELREVRMRCPRGVQKAMHNALLVYAINGETLPQDQGSIFGR